MKPAICNPPIDGLIDRIGSDYCQPNPLTFAHPNKMNLDKIELNEISCDKPLRRPRSAIEDDGIIDFDEFDNESEHEDGGEVDEDIVDEVDDEDFEDFDDTFNDGDDGLEEPYYDLSSESVEGAGLSVVSRKTTGLRNQSLSSS